MEVSEIMKRKGWDSRPPLIVLGKPKTKSVIWGFIRFYHYIYDDVNAIDCIGFGHIELKQGYTIKRVKNYTFFRTVKVI